MLIVIQHLQTYWIRSLHVFIWLIYLIALLSCFSNTSQAQSVEEPNEYIFQVILPPTWLISEAIFAYEVNGKYYLPLKELSQGLEFFADVDIENQYAQGFASREENSFIIDGARNELIIKGEIQKLGNEAVLVSDFLATDDLYVQLEVLNQIWPLSLTLDLSNLVISVESTEDLSFMRNLEREERQKLALLKKEEAAISKILLPRRKNDYDYIGKPVIDYQGTYTYSHDEHIFSASNNLSGLLQFGKTQADFSTNLRYADSEFVKPDNIRLRFSRSSAGDEYLFPDLIRRFEAGDVSLRQRDLVASSASGRGIFISNDNRSNDRAFDEITFETTGPPGWDFELFNNNQLIDFGVVPDDGLVLLEDVILGFGNNEIKIVFYGPQGQIREENRRYAAGNNMLSPGEFKYTAGFVDTDRSFILLNNEPRTEPRGITRTLDTAFGLNKSITLFGNYTSMPLEDQRQTYVTVGSSFSTPIGLVEAQATKEQGAGHGLSIDYVTRFLDFRLNLRGSLFNDFESINTGFDSNQQESEVELQLARSLRIFDVPIGLRFNLDRIKRETGTTLTNMDFSQSLTRGGIRISNTLRTRLTDEGHQATSGSITSSVREGPWQFRGTGNYSWFPERKFNSATGQIRYRSEDDFLAALGLNYNLDSNDYVISTQLGYDFKKFLTSVDLAYGKSSGASLSLRLSSSFHPYTNDEKYSFSSSSKRASSPIRALVFHDKNLDGIMNEDEDPLEGVKIKYGRGKTRNTTNEDGIIIADLPQDRLTNISVDESSIADPYFISNYEGFSTIPIRGKMIDAVFPVIETGSVEGTAFKNSNQKAVAGLELDLINDDGEVVLTAETGFDGFYVFEFVPPGNYRLETSDRHTVKLLDNNVSVTVDELYAYGFDVFINDGNPNEPLDVDVFEELETIDEFDEILDNEKILNEDVYKSTGETFGPPVAEFAGSLGADGLISDINGIKLENAKIPSVVPRSSLYSIGTVNSNNRRVPAPELQEAIPQSEIKGGLYQMGLGSH